MPSSPAVTSPATAYSLEGSILDACDRRPRAPDPLATAPPSHSVSVWIVQRGVVASVDVSGLVVVSVWERPPGGPVRRLVLLDEQATPEQVRALVDLVQGRMGTLSRFASPVDEDLGVYQVPVEWELSDGRAVVRVPGHLELVVLEDSSEAAVDIPEYDLVWKMEDGDALRGEIHVAGRVAAEP